MYFVFTGPESSGKTTLAVLAQEKWGGALVREVAREFLEVRNGIYEFTDLRIIGEKQWESEKELKKEAGWQWCDTDLLTIIIWSLDKFGKVEQDLVEKWHKQTKEKRFYFLCSPDIPWEYDPLRENPHDRDRIFDIYLSYLENNNLSYAIVKGDVPARLGLVEHTFRKYIHT